MAIINVDLDLDTFDTERQKINLISTALGNTGSDLTPGDMSTLNSGIRSALDLLTQSYDVVNTLNALFDKIETERDALELRSLIYAIATN
jgi:hypothetical protein